MLEMLAILKRLEEEVKKAGQQATFLEIGIQGSVPILMENATNALDTNI